MNLQRHHLLRHRCCISSTRGPRFDDFAPKVHILVASANLRYPDKNKFAHARAGHSALRTCQLAFIGLPVYIRCLGSESLHSESQAINKSNVGARHSFNPNLKQRSAWTKKAALRSSTVESLGQVRRGGVIQNVH